MAGGVMLGRRTLFKGLVAGVAAVSVPVKFAAAKFAPSVAPIAGNTLVTPSMISREALLQLKSHMVLGDKIHREYKREFSE
jgi:hypothetical protein